MSEYTRINQKINSNYMFKLQTHRGFTLIELLVVIAIIGILAATVLASLGTARQSGNDASTQSQVSAAKAQAEVYATANNNSYANVCTAATGLVPLLTGIARTAPGSDAAVTNPATAQTANTDGTGGTIICRSTISAWVLSAPLNRAAGGFFCADSTGFSGIRVTPAPANAMACPAS